MATRPMTQREPSPRIHVLDESGTQTIQCPGRTPVDHRDRTDCQHPEPIPVARLLPFVQMMAHDFRHHLSAVYAFSEFMSVQCSDPVDGWEFMTDIRLAMDCMTDQLESLLLFAETGHVFRPRRQSLAPVIERAVQMVRPHSEMNSVSVRSQIESDTLGCVDCKRLCSAIFNLLLNACQAAVPLDHREVVIALHDDQKNVFVRVTDNGPGVPDEIRKDLFRPFMQAGRKRRIGLGLSIAKYVAQEHGGDAYLELSRPGKTVFVLKLPKSGPEAGSRNAGFAALAAPHESVVTVSE
jgi:signal transduction histidine kinase